MTHQEVKQLISIGELLPTTRINNLGEEEYDDKWYFADNKEEKYNLISADNQIIFRSLDVAGVS